MFGFTNGYRCGDDMMLNALYQHGTNICQGGYNGIGYPKRGGFLSGYPVGYTDSMLSPDRQYNRKDTRNKLIAAGLATVALLTKPGRALVGLVCKGIKALF